MKSLKKIAAILFLPIFAFIITTCSPLNPPAGLSADYVYLRFAQPSFGGNWYHLKDRVTAMKLTFDDSLYALEQKPIERNERVSIEYSTNGYYSPALPGFDPEMFHVFKPAERDPVIDTVYTKFFYMGEIPETDAGIDMNALSDVSNFPYFDYKLLNGKTNIINLSYNPQSDPQAQFTVTNLGIGPEGSEYVNLHEDSLYNFDVEVTHVKKSAYSHKDSLSFVVMGDGYNNADITFFQEYVTDAFQSPAHFNFPEKGWAHDHRNNHLFEKYWGRTNVYMFLTASPDTGIDTVKGHNNKKNIFQFNSDAKGPGDIRRMKKVIASTYYKTQLHWKEIDAYIILVNNGGVGSYSYAYADNYEIEHRNKQPIFPVIIQAPTGRYSFQDNFHGYVYTDTIAHELGHAIARLQDENSYEDTTQEQPEQVKTYYEKFRNISAMVNGKLKWQSLINSNNGKYFNSTAPLEITDDNSQILVIYRNPQFLDSNGKSDRYYIPTVNSVMRGVLKSDNYQYGPVNTYHMEGSIKTRLGELPPQDPEAYVYLSGDVYNYEWNGYPLSKFTSDNEWPPEKFVYTQ